MFKVLSDTIRQLFCHTLTNRCLAIIRPKFPLHGINSIGLMATVCFYDITTREACLLLAIKPVVEHPQLLATSRHNTQGLVDVKSEVRDADSRTLSGTSEVVAGDEYELRLMLPDSQAWTMRCASVNGVPLHIRPQPGDPVHTLRLHFTPLTTKTASWCIHYISPTVHRGISFQLVTACQETSNTVR